MKVRFQGEAGESKKSKKLELTDCSCYCNIACLHVTAGGTVNLDEYEVEPTEDRAVLLSRTRESAQWRAAVYARLGTTSKTVSESHTLEMESFTELKRTLRRIERLVKDAARMPARRISNLGGVDRNTTDRGTVVRVGAANAQGQDFRPATLCRNSREP